MKKELFRKGHPDMASYGIDKTDRKENQPHHQVIFGKLV